MGYWALILGDFSFFFFSIFLGWVGLTQSFFFWNPNPAHIRSSSKKWTQSKPKIQHYRTQPLYFGLGRVGLDFNFFFFLESKPNPNQIRFKKMDPTQTQNPTQPNPTLIFWVGLSDFRVGCTPLLPS